ncbi:hypothetical protein BDV28DRAFT_151042 [Aspergillus coremiiformis]|uniref:Uncharacterized protein n=1 Tax=Aspergillus coremiiformis TaxID=138285 RepID=A0A5N6Z070_9EURO|nr:hypothetical protein BDV28DRAFT_151042 [Aspergillus coremiiformis]
MTKDLTFDIRFDNELAHDYYGDGKKLAESMRRVYHDKNLQFPDEFESTLTTPPIHFMSVTAPDGTDIDDLRRVDVPPGLNVEILDFHM